MAHRRDFIKSLAIGGIVTVLSPKVLAAGSHSRQKESNKMRSLRIARITDVHILNQSNAEACFANVLREIKISPTLSLIQLIV